MTLIASKGKRAKYEKGDLIYVNIDTYWRENNNSSWSIYDIGISEGVKEIYGVVDYIKVTNKVRIFAVFIINGVKFPTSFVVHKTCPTRGVKSWK